MGRRMVGFASSAVFLLALSDAAVSDVRSFRIPNRASVTLLAAFVVFALASGVGMDVALRHGAACVLVFIAGAALFALGIWGGGDVKLLAAASLWTGFAGLPRLLAVMSVAGGLLAVSVLLLRRLPAANEGWLTLWQRRVTASGHVPYGVAIAAGGLDWWLKAGLRGVGL